MITRPYSAEMHWVGAIYESPLHLISLSVNNKSALWTSGRFCNFRNKPDAQGLFLHFNFLDIAFFCTELDNHFFVGLCVIA